MFKECKDLHKITFKKTKILRVLFIFTLLIHIIYVLYIICVVKINDYE